MERMAHLAGRRFSSLSELEAEVGSIPLVVMRRDHSGNLVERNFTHTLKSLAGKLHTELPKELRKTYTGMETGAAPGKFVTAFKHVLAISAHVLREEKGKYAFDHHYVPAAEDIIHALRELRKSGDPELLKDPELIADAAIAMLYHDAAEDHSVNLEDLGKIYGKRVADFVGGLSHPKPVRYLIPLPHDWLKQYRESRFVNELKEKWIFRHMFPFTRWVKGPDDFATYDRTAAKDVMSKREYVRRYTDHYNYIAESGNNILMLMKTFDSLRNLEQIGAKGKSKFERNIRKHTAFFETVVLNDRFNKYLTSTDFGRKTYERFKRALRKNGVGVTELIRRKHSDGLHLFAPHHFPERHI